MSKIKFTKGELKKQRDSLKQFQHYLPTLQLKKQQIQKKILEIRKELDERLKFLDDKEKSIKEWIGLLADPRVDFNQIKEWLKPIDITTEKVNIAGANLPFLKDIIFPPPSYDLFTAPFWLDKGLEELRLYVNVLIEIKIIQQQLEILERELRITTQRVNLFEKIKIPECKDNIRRIRIYLGDQQANAVGVSKVAKHKVETRDLQEMLV